MKITDAVEMAGLIKRKGRPLTFLIGAGFSASAGIPLAAQMVRDMRKYLNFPAVARDERYGEYASLMSQMADPDDRHRFIAHAIEKGKNRINWSHLLLAKLIEKGTAKRVLTTNFDSLMVRALAVTGQPIQTYDLTSHGRYSAAILDPPVVIYLHGQVHSALLVNSVREIRAARKTYEAVLKEAVQDSSIVVVGYSGVNDVLFETLKKFSRFPYGLYWSNYAAELDDDVRKFLAQRDGANYLTGYSADELMRELVIEGFKMELPKLIGDPIGAIKEILENLVDFPRDENRATGDPREVARGLVLKLEELAKDLPEAKALRINEAAMRDDWEMFDRSRVGITPDPGSDISRVIGDGMLRRCEKALRENDVEEARRCIDGATLFGVADQDVLQALQAVVLCRQSVAMSDGRKRDDLFAQARMQYKRALDIETAAGLDRGSVARNERRGNAHWNWALATWEQARRRTDDRSAMCVLLQEADHELGVVDTLLPKSGDRYRVWALVANDLGIVEFEIGQPSLAEELWRRSDERFTLTMSLDGADYKTYHNWGMALSERAKVLLDAAVFKEARDKLRLAMERNPDYNLTYKAHFSLGNAIVAQAVRKVGVDSYSGMLQGAEKEYREALSIKPDFAVVHFGLACVCAQTDPPDLVGCERELVLWKQGDMTASRAAFDEERAFDGVRGLAGIRTLVLSLFP